jgi:hypothetical protein
MTFPAVAPRVLRSFVVSLALVITAIHAPSLRAQANKTITIVMLNGKTGKPIIPDNFVIRFNELNAIRNETLVLNDDGTGKVTLPAGVTQLSVQGTYHGSMDIYINCDAGMEKDTSTLHWYSIADILTSGVAAPNECYKGKYANPSITAHPGQFIFFVREIGWLDKNAE